MNQENIGLILTIGKALSAVALLVLLAAMINAWRRPSFPAVSYGSITLAHRRLRWVWIGILAGSLALGAAQDPVTTRTRTMEDEEALAAAAGTRHTNLSLPLPFYHYERERTHSADALVQETVTESLVIPWELFSALFAYLVLVLRWNPENRWALRILKGKKRFRERDGGG